MTRRPIPAYGYGCARMRRVNAPIRRRLAALGGFAAVAVAAVGFAGCETKTEGANLVAGKQAFVAKCGVCHTLTRAGTKGNVGPNLDAAFQQAIKDGFKRDSILGMVQHQILYPARTGTMPGKLFKDDDQDCSKADKKKYGGKCATAHDVAAYVSSVVAKPGKDSGLLATAIGGAQKALAKALGGKLSIPADPNGQLLFQYKNAEAPAGPLTIDMKNPASTPHNIAIQGGGVNKQGPTVQGGKTSVVQVTLKPGKYTFLCTVPGHAQAGMKGTLTVK
jgi:plastocyanin